MVWRIAQRFMEQPCCSLSSCCVLSKSWIYMCFESQWVRPITHLCSLIRHDLTFSFGGALYSICIYSKILYHSGSKSHKYLESFQNNWIMWKFYFYFYGGTSILFSIMIILIYIPTNSIPGFTGRKY